MRQAEIKIRALGLATRYLRNRRTYMSNGDDLSVISYNFLSFVLGEDVRSARAEIKEPVDLDYRFSALISAIDYLDSSDGPRVSNDGNDAVAIASATYHDLGLDLVDAGGEQVSSKKNEVSEDKEETTSE